MFFQIKKNLSMKSLCVSCHTQKTLFFSPYYLMHLRSAVADGPQKRNSHCLKALLPFGFSVSDAQV